MSIKTLNLAIMNTDNRTETIEIQRINIRFCQLHSLSTPTNLWLNHRD